MSPMASVARMPPRGRYLAHEAGRLAGVSGNRIGQWARRGYIRSSQSRHGALPRVYSFHDVAEAMVVHELVDRGVRHLDIRTAIEGLREDHGDWPLTSARSLLATSDVGTRGGERRSMLLAGRGGQFYDLGRDSTQQVISLGNLARIAEDLSRGGWAVRDLPDLRLIEVHPDRIGGRPAIRGRRIAAEIVAEMASSAEGREALDADYDLTAAEIRDAQRWWAVAREYERAA